ncbi:E3 ubiquitin-protein ligase mind-bomb [Paragonimus westermani]|uniref:E3 ubiquitin-protein ligase mind-bomb n=1 Tax=Paragonimus westermani TaxID=34504 RepID=A0A5J4NUR9_9TREM|nr:E3 ubiquitin-protein ligase mind-bomb [Paragonimus westermani]
MAESVPTAELHDPGTYATGVGCRVVRGPDWKWTKQSPIYGIRWKCVVCLSTDLCSNCYHGDKHTLAHQFLRITAPYKTRVIVGRRLKQRRVEAMGLFPKARVVRGIDWSWDSQDCVSPLTSSGTGSLLLGTSGSVLTGRGLLRSSVDQVSAGPILLPTQGRITDRRDWYPWAPRSAALVAWDSGAYNVYRVGYAGLIDLKAIRPAKGGTYYVDHLPLLADLRGYSNMEPVAVAEESTTCAVEDDGAELCRDSSGNPLVPNWTNLQDLELRRRQHTTTTTLPENRRCHRVPSGSNRNRDHSQERVCQQLRESVLVDHTNSLHAGHSTSTHEPAASSCLNVCTLASRLQLQPSSVESCHQLNPTGRSHLRRQPTRPSQCARERETEPSSNSRSSATSSGSFRTLGQTARSLLTDLLRTNLSSTSSAPSGSRIPATLPTANQTQSRSNITSPPSLRSHNRSSRAEDRTTNFVNPNAVILSRSSHQRDRNMPNTTHQQRVVVNTSFAGSTALHVACDAGHLACVALLLQFGAKRHLRDGSGNQAIHAAAQGGNVNILRLLLDPRAGLGDERSVSPADELTLTCAESTGNLLNSDECTAGNAHRLLSVESDDTADVNSRNALRQTPLHLAINRHDFIVAQCLLEEWNALSNLQVTFRF